MPSAIEGQTKVSNLILTHFIFNLKLINVCSFICLYCSKINTHSILHLKFLVTAMLPSIKQKNLITKAIDRLL